MKKFLGVALLGVVAAAPVQGQFTSQVCAGPAFGVCGIAEFNLTNANTLVVSLYNGSTAATSTLASSLTEILFFNAVSGITPTLSSVFFHDWTGAAYVVTNITNGYSLDTDPNGGGWKVNTDFLLGTKGNSGITTCGGAATDLTKVNQNDKFYAQTCNDAGDAIFGPESDFVRFTFALSGLGYSSTDLKKLDWGYHAQMLGDGGSVWCVGDRTDPTNEKYCGPTIMDPDDPQGDVVPEPATMTLLATGLAGMAAARRRRKNNA